MPTAIYDSREAVCEGQSPDSVPAAKEVKTTPSRLQRIIFSLSLANLCFLVVWGTVIGLASNEQMKYFEMAPPSWSFVAALLIDIFATACVVYALLWARLRFPALRTIVSCLLSIACCFAVLQLEELIVQRLKSPNEEILQVTVAIATLLAGLLFARRAKAAVKVFVMVLAPLLPVLVLDAAWVYSKPTLKELGVNRASGKLPSIANHQRLVWIIFDELDYRLAFEARPARLQLPEFDRLREISISAEHAHSPAGLTNLSLPSLFVGKRVVEERMRTDDISMRFMGASAWHDLTSEPNIFRRLRAAGLNTAVSGWHHSYCRVIGNDLSDCASAPNGTDSVAFYDAITQWPFLTRCMAIALWQAESSPLERLLYRRGRFLWASHSSAEVRSVTQNVSKSTRSVYSWLNIRNRSVREQQIHAAEVIRSNALRMAKDPDLNLVFIHAPAPHLPGIWNSRTRQFTATEHSDYVDNLAFTDLFLGELRTELESTGQWNRTALLISADHPFRTNTWKNSSLWTAELARITSGQQGEYVPFILKLPGQHTPFTYHRDFNTVVSGELVWQILNGQIQRPEQVAAWLDGH